MIIFKKTLGWVFTVVLAVAIALFVNLFVFQPHEVLGYSMQPTLGNGSIGIMSRVQHTFNIEPNYNDIVVIDSRVNHIHTLKDDIIDTFKSNLISRKLFNHTDHIYWIKRVIGRPGDILEFKNESIYRNGKLLHEPYLKEKSFYPNCKKVTIPKNYIFVMGDNRNVSTDSRTIGPVPIENVVGKLLFSF